MINDLAILKTASALAGHAARRHAVIAENIANADTPDYKAKDLKPFAEIYHASQLSGEAIIAAAENTKLIQAASAADPNGNTVSLDEQMLMSAQAVGAHDLAMLMYRKTLDMMKLAIGKNI